MGELGEIGQIGIADETDCGSPMDGERRSSRGGRMRVLREVARVARGEKYSRVSDAREKRARGWERRTERETGGIDCDAALGTCPIHDRQFCLYLPNPRLCYLHPPKQRASQTRDYAS